jgi:hypothetical protein
MTLGARVFLLPLGHFLTAPCRRFREPLLERPAGLGAAYLVAGDEASLILGVSRRSSAAAR